MTTHETILLVDDDPDVTNLLDVYLSDEGYEVLTAHTAAEMWQQIKSCDINLVLLDVGLPDANGFDLAPQLKSQINCGIIIVSRKSDDIDQIVGLEVGADDYVTKPFEPRTLLARIRSVLRRCSPEPPLARQAHPTTEHVSFGKWRFDPATYRLASEEGKETVLSANESILLHYLIQNAGSVLSRNDLMLAITGRPWEYMDRSVDILIARLRKKIEPKPSAPTVIKTVRGTGYVFNLEAVISA